MAVRVRIAECPGMLNVQTVEVNRLRFGARLHACLKPLASWTQRKRRRVRLLSPCTAGLTIVCHQTHEAVPKSLEENAKESGGLPKRSMGPTPNGAEKHTAIRYLLKAQTDASL